MDGGGGLSADLTRMDVEWFVIKIPRKIKRKSIPRYTVVTSMKEKKKTQRKTELNSVKEEIT